MEIKDLLSLSFIIENHHLSPQQKVACPCFTFHLLSMQSLWGRKENKKLLE